MQGKTVFITGATSGFGEACAKLFYARGAKVIACGRREERLESVKDELEKKSPPPAGGRIREGVGEIHTLALDVRDNGAVEKAVASLPPEFSAIDVLINNAGLALGLGSFDTTMLSDAQQMVETNILGVIYCTRAILPGMVARNRGHIINLGSVAGEYPYPGGNVYGGTKAFIAQFSLNLRADLLGKNIRVTSIEPGMAETEFALVRFAGDTDKANAVYAGVHPLTGEDIAEAIYWCVTQPPHVNVNRLELMPTQQAFAPFAVHRGQKN